MQVVPRLSDSVRLTSCLKSSLRAERSNPECGAKTGLLRRFAPRNDEMNEGVSGRLRPDLTMSFRGARSANPESRATNFEIPGLRLRSAIADRRRIPE